MIEVREKHLVLNGSFCDCNFYADGPQTYAEAGKLGRQLCPHFQTCNNGGLNPITGFQCVMLFGIQVAQHLLKNLRTNITLEMEDFRRAEVHPPKGWVVSDDRREFRIIPDGEEAIKFVEKFAHVALNDGDPTEHKDPRLAIGDDFASVVRYAATPEGAIDLSKMQELEGRFGYNGGQPCDVLRGPCSCGAWHY